MKRLCYSVLIFVLLGLVPAQLIAQRSDSSKKAFTLAISASVELSQFNFSSLNRELANHGLLTVNHPLLFLSSISAFPNKPTQKVFFGLQYGSARSKNDDNDNLTQLNIYLANLNFRYVVWRSPRSMLYPGIGIGAMHYSLLLQNKAKTPPSFDGALSNLTGERHLGTDNYSLNLSLSYSWALDQDADFRVGMHAGYRIGLNKARWKLSTGEGLSGSPTTSASGFYTGIDFLIL